MRLQDLLERPELRLSLLTQEGHGLDRAVSAVFTTDLIDPGRYLSGGEIVLTGLMWHKGAKSSERFVSALARAGVTAIGAGEAALGVVPADLLAACRRHQVPLFKVPTEVSFNAIVDAVTPSMWSERATGLSGALSRQRTMIAALAAGAHLPDLLLPLAAKLGLECWVLTATGSLLAGTSPLPTPLREALLAAFHTARRLPAALPASAGLGGDAAGLGGAAVSAGVAIAVHRVGGAADRRLDALCVAIGGGSAAAAEELLSLVELERASTDERRRIERELTTDLLRAARHDSDPAILRAHMTTCGLPPETPTAVIAARVLPGAISVALELLDQVVRSGVDGQPGQRLVAAAELDEAAASVVPLGDGLAAVAGRVHAALATVEPSLHGTRIAVGISSAATGAEGLRDAIAQAFDMLNLAVAQQTPVSVMANDHVASHSMLLASVPSQTRQAFHDQLLGVLLAYDREKQSELVPTLRAYFEASGSWKECAQRLHVHVNTLRYRLRRIEQLTGRDLSRFDNCVDLFLALRLHR